MNPFSFDFNLLKLNDYLNYAEDMPSKDRLHLKKTVCNLLNSKTRNIYVLDEGVNEDINDGDYQSLEYLNENMEEDSTPPYMYEDSQQSGPMYLVKICGFPAISFRVMGYQTIFIAK